MPDDPQLLPELPSTTEIKDGKLTVKFRKWVDLYLNSENPKIRGNATESAIRVYACKSRPTAASIGSENLRKLENLDLLETAGITDERLMNVLSSGLDSNKTISAQVLVKEDGGVMTKADEGVIEIPDHAVRHKYLETALRMKGRLRDRTNITEPDETIAIIIQIPHATPEELSRYRSIPAQTATSSSDITRPDL